MCNVQALITNGILRMGEDTEVSEESLTFEYVLSLCCPLRWLHDFTCLLCRCRREYRVFQKLLGMVPHLGDRLMDCSNEESMAMADLVCPLQSNIISFLLLFITDSERCF